MFTQAHCARFVLSLLAVLFISQLILAVVHSFQFLFSVDAWPWFMCCNKFHQCCSLTFSYHLTQTYETVHRIRTNLPLCLCSHKVWFFGLKGVRVQSWGNIYTWANDPSLYLIEDNEHDETLPIPCEGKCLLKMYVVMIPTLFPLHWFCRGEIVPQ